MKPLFVAASLLACLVGAPALAESSGLKVVDTIKIGGTGGWDYLNVDPILHRLYIAHGASVAAVDLTTGTVNTHLADANGAHIALPIDGGKTLLLTQGKSNKASFLDAMSGANLGDITTGAKPDGAIFDSLSGQIFVLDNGGNQIDVLDAKTHAVTGKIALTGAPESGDTDGKGLLFTHLEDKNAIVVINTLTRTVKATFALSDCDEPSGLVFIPDQRLLMSACATGKARISNADTGAEIALLPTGPHADGAAYDIKTKTGYIPSGSGTLTAISFDGTPRVIDTITTKPGARTIALDPDTGRLYLPFAQFGPPAKPGERPTVLPDTFSILVLGK